VTECRSVPGRRNISVGKVRPVLEAMPSSRAREVKSAGTATQSQGLTWVQKSDRMIQERLDGGSRAMLSTESRVQRLCFVLLTLSALTYALISGLRTVTDFDLGWQLSTGRWIAQHHQIPSTDVFSYTALGQPWVYPVGSAVILYAAYLLGNYCLLSWLGAVACVGTTALALRRGSPVSAVLAILAVPLIAARTTPRAEMFTLVLFAAFLTLLWQQHQTGHGRLWLLPILMCIWVNLHPGFVAGFALLGGYVLLEVGELCTIDNRRSAADRLRRAWPWLVASCAAPLVNPWGWKIFLVLLRQQSAMSAHSRFIAEWVPAKVNWTTVKDGLSLRDPAFLFLLLVVAAVAILASLLQHKPGVAVLLSGAAILGLRHIRLAALFSVLVVVIAGAVLHSTLAPLTGRIGDARLRLILGFGVVCVLMLLVWYWSTDLITDRNYLRHADLASFGTGRSWWFPERAAAFIEQEDLPPEIFNTYAAGGYVTWRLGPKYHDYIDGRAIPFGAQLVQRSVALLESAPDSSEWQQESQRYNINTIIVPLGRDKDLQSFPALQQFCTSESWRPVYLDETSAVFVRRIPAAEGLIQRLQTDCSHVPLPKVIPSGTGARAFNQWARAAATLNALGRFPEALTATSKALAIFPDSASVHLTRGELFSQSGRLSEAEREYLTAATLAPDDVAWAKLAQIYDQQGSLNKGIDAWKRAADLALQPYDALLSLAYDYLDANRPEDALRAFEHAKSSWMKSVIDVEPHNLDLANLAHGRALAFSSMGQMNEALASQEEAVKLAPQIPRYWLDLANIYDRAGRSGDAERARKRAKQPSFESAPGGLR